VRIAIKAVSDHFHLEVQLIEAGKGARRPVEDYRLSRYACYLIVQNADPNKPIVALGFNHIALAKHQSSTLALFALRSGSVCTLLWLLSNSNGTARKFVEAVKRSCTVSRRNLSVVRPDFPHTSVIDHIRKEEEFLEVLISGLPHIRHYPGFSNTVSRVF